MGMILGFVVTQEAYELNLALVKGKRAQLWTSPIWQKLAGVGGWHRRI